MREHSMSTVWNELLRKGAEARPFRLRRTDIKCRQCLKPLSRPLVRFRFPEAVDYIGLPQGTFWLSRDDIYNNYRASDNWSYVTWEGYPEELHLNPKDIFSGAAGCETCQTIRENAVVTDWEHTLSFPLSSVIIEELGEIRFAGVDVMVIGGKQPLSSEVELQTALRAVLARAGGAPESLLIRGTDSSLTVFWFAAVESFYHGLPLPEIVRRAAHFRQIGANLAIIPVSSLELVPDVPVILPQAN